MHRYRSCFDHRDLQSSQDIGRPIADPYPSNYTRACSVDQGGSVPMMLVRSATSSDSASIAQIHISAWRAAYTGIVDQAHLDALSVEDRTRFWQAILSDPVKAASILVASEHNGDPHSVLGFASYGTDDAAYTSSASSGPSPAVSTEKAKPAEGELRALYVDPAHWSQGIGRQLCAKVFETLQDAGHGSIRVTVLEDNVRAVTMYKQMGFERTRCSRSELAGKELSVLNFSKRLTVEKHCPAAQSS